MGMNLFCKIGLKKLLGLSESKYETSNTDHTSSGQPASKEAGNYGLVRKSKNPGQRTFGSGKFFPNNSISSPLFFNILPVRTDPFNAI